MPHPTRWSLHSACPLARLLHGVVLHLLDLEVPEGTVARDGAEHDDGERAADGDGRRLVAEGHAAGRAHELCGAQGQRLFEARSGIFKSPGAGRVHSPGPNSPLRKMKGCTRTSRSRSCAVRSLYARLTSFSSSEHEYDLPTGVGYSCRLREPEVRSSLRPADRRRGLGDIGTISLAVSLQCQEWSKSSRGLVALRSQAR